MTTPLPASSTASTRTREDDQIVDVFLRCYRGGRLAKVEWLLQHVSNVEAIATDNDGTRMAIEHTRVDEFEHPVGRQTNPDDDPILGKVGAHLAGISLPVQDRVFLVNVDPKNLKRLLTYKEFCPRTLNALTEWARNSLPALRENKEFEIAIPVKLPPQKRTVRIGVQVLEECYCRNGVEEDCYTPILACCGYLWPRSELGKSVTKALENKLPKLSRAQADYRILMLELVTLTDDAKVFEALLDRVKDHPDFGNVDEVVFARNLFEYGVVFRSWNTKSKKWSVCFAPVQKIS